MTAGPGWGSVGEQLGCAGARRGTKRDLAAGRPREIPWSSAGERSPPVSDPDCQREGSSQICSPKEAEAEWEGIARSVGGVGPGVLFGHLLGVRSCVRGPLR